MATNNIVKNVLMIVPLLSSLVLGVIWVETRYQQVDVSVCHVEKNALDLEVSANELRLEFYNKELLELTSVIEADDTEQKKKEFRITKLGSDTNSITNRLRVIKTELKAKSC